MVGVTVAVPHCLWRIDRGDYNSRSDNGMLLEKLFSTTQTIDITPGPGVWIGGERSSSGESVTPDTAMTLSHYFACLRNISEDVAKLSLRINKRLPNNGRDPQPDHPVTRLMMDSFNPETSAMSGRETLQHWAMGWGRGCAEITWTPLGAPLLWPIHPTRIQFKRNAAKQLYAEVHNDNGTIVPIQYDKLFHLHGLGNGIDGYSIIQYACESVGRAIAVQKHSGAVFAGGGVDRVALKHPNKPSPAATENIRRSWVAQYGGAGNAAPVIVGDNMDVVRVGIPPDDAQMIETMQFTVEDLARWFRCPLSKIGHFLRAQGWSTLEMLNIDYMTDTLLPWTQRWEAEIARKLLTVGERATGTYYARHDFKKLLQADAKTRSEFYNTRRRIGTLTANEIRALEDENPIGPEGDEYVIDQGLVNLKTLLEEPKPEPVVMPFPAPGSEPDGDDDEDGNDEDDDNNLSAMCPLAADAVRRCLRKEVNQIRTATKRYRDKGRLDEFVAWSDQFFSDHVADVADAVRPVVTAHAHIHRLAVDVCGISEIYARWHCERSRGCVDTIETNLDALVQSGAEYLLGSVTDGIN